ncbi:hypothetical protein [Streptomyces sp. NPDC001843]|uniref:hypothetical protein n=1 Tax=Streptomyces sp. NPDC001843 TaxID=3364617 RepID=UPI00369FA2C6
MLLADRFGGEHDAHSYESGSSTITCVWNPADTTGMSADGKVEYDIADDGKDPVALHPGPGHRRRPDRHRLTTTR